MCAWRWGEGKSNYKQGGRRGTMEQLFFSFLISRGSKYAHYYYLLQAKVQLSMIFSASFWIFHSHLILKRKKNVLTSFATRRMLAGEISTFYSCLVWELRLYWNHIYPCMHTLHYGKNIAVFLFWNSNWKKYYFRLQNVLRNIISISTFECGNVGF